ncbi:Uncharacterised protein [Serratia odorifera]|uniref:Uncharacterized protein n=1 Tax=Serratia odorifera TaxID=618 RepID=A0A447KMA7_SEROD|nr:Uncharacterised protein [Serratia odorifera]
MLFRQLTRQAFQRQDLVTGLQHFTAVLQIEFILPGCGLGHHAGQRYRLQFGMMRDVIEQRAVTLWRINRKILRQAGLRHAR